MDIGINSERCSVILCVKCMKSCLAIIGNEDLVKLNHCSFVIYSNSVCVFESAVNFKSKWNVQTPTKFPAHGIFSEGVI